MKIANSPYEFYQKLYPIAREMEQKYGISARILIAHAAHETGYGKHVIDNNLFNIKAGSSWTGPVEIKWVKEFDPKRGWIYSAEKFRKYSSLRESMEDYIRLLKNSSRYQRAWKYRKNPEKFFSEIQKAGYATDPSYAYKALRVYKSLFG